MPNKYLLPFQPRDVITVDQNIGFSKTVSDFGLRDIAELCIPSGLYIEENREAGAIPSPVAHMLQFKKLLGDKNSSAVNELREMLAVIALQKVFGFNITVEKVELDTLIGSVIKNGLEDSYGYYLTDGKLTYFCLNGVPFAFVCPEIGICPLKTYPANLFENVGLV